MYFFYSIFFLFIYSLAIPCRIIAEQIQGGLEGGRTLGGERKLKIRTRLLLPPFLLPSDYSFSLIFIFLSLKESSYLVI